MTSPTYRTHDVPVAGGTLRVGVWEPPEATAETPTVLAIHGITASHRCWLAVVEALPQVRIVAPDLRGRGRSNQLPGPYGMPAHAADLVAVLDHPATAYAAVAEDSAELHGGESLLAAIAALRHPTITLRSPRGLMNEDRGLYTLEELDAWADRPHRPQCRRC